MKKIIEITNCENEKIKAFFNEEAFQGFSKEEEEFLSEIYLSNPLLSLDEIEIFNEQAKQGFHHLVIKTAIYEKYIDLFGDILYSKISPSVEKKFYELHEKVLKRFKGKFNE